MKKKQTLILFLISTAILIISPNKVRGELFFNFNYLEIDKKIYHNDMNFLINSSWNLSYDQESEVCFVQIRMFDQNNSLIWNSTKYYEGGEGIEKSYNISINLLPIRYSNRSSELKVCLYYYYTSIYSINQFEYYGNTSIIILQRGEFFIKTFTTDKDYYNVDEVVNIKMEWNLLFNENYEYAFIKLIIFNINNSIVWNSSNYSGNKFQSEDFSVKLAELNLNDKFKISVFCFYNSSIDNKTFSNYYVNKTIGINTDGSNFLKHFMDQYLTIIIISIPIILIFLFLIIKKYLIRDKKSIQQITIEY